MPRYFANKQPYFNHREAACRFKKQPVISERFRCTLFLVLPRSQLRTLRRELHQETIMKNKTVETLDTPTLHAAQNARLGLISVGDLSLLTGVDVGRLSRFAKTGSMVHYGE